MKPKLTHNQIAIQLEDEHRYGPPSPRRTHHNNTATNNPSAGPTDELFLAESYPPSNTIHLPFFNLTLDSPIGMGRGQPILPHQAPSPVYGSVERIWRRISKTLLEKPYQLGELVDTLSYPAQHSSLNSLQRSLANYHLQLPGVVRDHFLTHDGQDVFSSNSNHASTSASSLGIVWGLWLMSCEEVEAEWGFWRRFDGGLVPTDAFTATDFSSSFPQQQHPLKQQDPPSSSPITPSDSSSPNQPRFNQSMSSCPAGWVHEVYSHPGWLPLLSDRVGNYIGVDLSPPLLQSSSSTCSPPSSSSSSPSPHHHHHHHQSNQASSSSSSIVNPHLPHLGGGQGHARPEPGQVIAFGREIDQKVILWRGEGSQGWANWLASFADDLEDGKFARLIGRKVKKSSNNKTCKGRRNSDGERGGWSYSDEESDDTEDGLGDLGYFSQDTSFVGHHDEDGDFHGWKLAPEYRGMSVIEALCARSQQRWAEVGSYSSRHVFSKSEEKISQPSSTRQSPRLKSTENLTTKSNEANNNGSVEGINGSTEENQGNNPGTPIAFVTPPSPRPSDANLGGSTTPSTKPRVVIQPLGTRGSSPSSSGLHPVPPPSRSQKSSPTQTDLKSRRPRVHPPAPMSLDLPTMDSLMLEVESPSINNHRNSSSSSSSVHHHHLKQNDHHQNQGNESSRNNNSNNTPHLVSRLSMVGQRISSEMTRRSTSSPGRKSPSSSSGGSGNEVNRTRHGHGHGHGLEDVNEKDMIGMVMIINGSDKHPSSTSNQLHHLSDITTSTTTTTTTTSSSSPHLDDNNEIRFPVKLHSSLRSTPLDSDDLRRSSTDALGIMKNVV